MKGELKEAVERLTDLATKKEGHARLYPTPVSAASADRQLASDIRLVLAALSQPEGPPAMGVEEEAFERLCDTIEAAICSWDSGQYRMAEHIAREIIALSPQPVPDGEDGVG